MPKHHSPLYEGVRRLADIVSRSILDWQREITDIADKLPPVDEEAIDIIEDALKDAPRTRFFTRAASSPELIIVLRCRITWMHCSPTGSQLNETGYWTGWLSGFFVGTL